MICWWNKLKFRNFTVDLNEKLYKPTFAKRIRSRYLQNLQMVLSMLCSLPNYFGINVSENYIVSSNFFRPKSPMEFRESCRLSQRHTNCLLFCGAVIKSFANTKNRPEAPWDRVCYGSGTIIYWTCLCQ